MFTDEFGAVDTAGTIAAVLPAVFGLTLVIFVVLGLVLAYHWRRYSYNLAAAFAFQAVYWSVGGLLIAAMGTAIITFNS